MTPNLAFLLEIGNDIAKRINHYAIQVLATE
jgi:hypothetical protein